MSDSDNLLDPNVRESRTKGGKPEMLPNFIAILILGIISIVGCYPLGAPGLVCGIIGLSLWGKNHAMYVSDPGRYNPSSYKTAKAGRICAIIGICVSSVWIVVLLGLLVANA